MPEKQEKPVVEPGDHYLSGNEAIAEGCLLAGCRFFGGYPITPSSEIAEHMSYRLYEIGGTYIQMEDEIASIAAILGASWGGKKSMTATSGPGFSLMVENIGLGAMTETPCVIVNVMRGGPSTGLPTLVGQQDVMQAKWGSHGDYELITLCPWSIQEAFDMAIKAFNFAEKYRVPVIYLSDECIGHMMEYVKIPEESEVEIVNRKKPTVPPEEYKMYEATEKDDWVPPMANFGDGYKVMVTGLTHDERGYPDISAAAEDKLVRRLCNKIRLNADKIVDYETYEIADAEIVVVAYGISARAAKGAMRMAREKGMKVGMIRLKVIWPFPEKFFNEIATKVKKFVVAEINLGQIFNEVDRCAKGAKVSFIGKLGTVMMPGEILAKIEEVAE